MSARQTSDACEDSHMVEVRIGTRGDSLLLATDAPDLPISVTLESARLRAGTKPRDCFDLRGLPAYMADVAGTAMSEWVGPKTWESLEGDIRLVAGQAAGRVTITASLREARLDPINDGWSARLDITLDPGEELRQCASDVAAFLQGC